MNKQIPVTNDGDSPRFVGGKMIPPGETRLFEAHELPPEYQPAAEVSRLESADDPLLSISMLSVAKLELGLPDLTEEELLRLEAMEKAKDKPRQGALAAIVAERLHRAELKTPGGLESTDETGDTNNDGGAGE